MPPFKKAYSEIAENEDDIDNNSSIEYKAEKATVRKIANRPTKAPPSSMRASMSKMSDYIFENDPSNTFNNSLRYKNNKSQGVVVSAATKRNFKRLQEIYSQFDLEFQGYDLHSKEKKTFSGRGNTP
jgi:hypothetical protein